MAAALPDGSAQVLGKSFASRIDAVVGQWRERLRQQLSAGGPGPHETIGDAEADLREQVTALERDVVGLDATLSRELMARAEAEQAAMASISANDDDGARAALRAHERH